MEEYFTHFAFWCLFGSPLMLGSDIRKMSDEIKALVTNKDLIRINQDKKYCQPFFVAQPFYTHRKEKNYKMSIDNDFYYLNYDLAVPIIARYLDDGKIAVGIFNLTDGEAQSVYLHFLSETLGVPESSGKKLKFTNIADGSVTVAKNGFFDVNIALKAHCSLIYIAEVID